jgi:hypothetical protein
MIAAFISLVSWSAIAWGLSEPGVLAATEATPAAITIGLALLPAILMPMMTMNFLWAVQKVRAARRGENVIGRWTVSATELAEFAANNAARSARGTDYRNEWKPPRNPPAEGIEIIFVPDAVVVGRAFYALVTTGWFRFTGVQELRENPPAIEFGVISVVVSTTTIRRFFNTLRLPVSRSARGELDRVLDHFRRVSNREVVVNPDFYRPRIRIGLFVASFFTIPTALGFWLAGRARRSGDQDMENFAEGLAGGSLIFAGAGLLLAAIALSLRRRQHRG